VPSIEKNLAALIWCKSIPEMDSTPLALSLPQKNSAIFIADK
jgi:hypothetical protein